MKKVITKDKSITFFNEKYKEHYHSLSGALEEAFEKHAKPCRIKELAQENKINILDFCFGIGYNSGATLDIALKTNPKCRIFILGLENDKKILNKIKDLNPRLKNYDFIKKAAENLGFKNENTEIKIILGDARKSLKKIKKKFDAVLFDPFSPRKSPELWTENVFRDIFKLMKKNSILSTYSCAKSVRKNMKKAGFKVKDGPVVGRKSPGTLGLKE